MARRVVDRTGVFWGELDAINANFTELFDGAAATAEAISNMSGPVAQAEREVLASYGDIVSVEAKAKSLTKFGRNDSVGTSFQTVWEVGGNETYVTTNAIDTVSSSNAADVVAMTIEGHTVSGTGTSAQFTFVSQSLTLNGQAKVVLTTPLARVSRVAVTDAVPIAGDVYAYEDDTLSGGVPTTAAKIHMVVKGTNGQTQSYKAATTFSNTDYAFVTGGFASVNKKTNASVDVEFQVRLVGGVFRPVGRFSLNSTAQTTQQIQFDPYVIIPKNADVRVVAVASTTGVSVDATFQAYLAGVV